MPGTGSNTTHEHMAEKGEPKAKLAGQQNLSEGPLDSTQSGCFENAIDPQTLVEDKMPHLEQLSEDQSSNVENALNDQENHIPNSDGGESQAIEEEKTTLIGGMSTKTLQDYIPEDLAEQHHKPDFEPTDEQLAVKDDAECQDKVSGDSIDLIPTETSPDGANIPSLVEIYPEENSNANLQDTKETEVSEVSDKPKEVLEPASPKTNASTDSEIDGSKVLGEEQLSQENNTKQESNLPWETEKPTEELPWEENNTKQESNLPWETEKSTEELPWEENNTKQKSNLPWETEEPTKELPWEENNTKQESNLPWETEKSTEELPWEENNTKQKSNLPWETEEPTKELPWEENNTKQESNLPWETEQPTEELPWEENNTKQESNLPWETEQPTEKLPWEDSNHQQKSDFPWDNEMPQNDNTKPLEDNKFQGKTSLPKEEESFTQESSLPWENQNTQEGCNISWDETKREEKSSPHWESEFASDAPSGNNIELPREKSGEELPPTLLGDQINEVPDIVESEQHSNPGNSEISEVPQVHTEKPTLLHQQTVDLQKIEGVSEKSSCHLDESEISKHKNNMDHQNNEDKTFSSLQKNELTSLMKENIKRNDPVEQFGENSKEAKTNESDAIDNDVTNKLQNIFSELEDLPDTVADASAASVVEESSSKPTQDKVKSLSFLEDDDLLFDGIEHEKPHATQQQTQIAKSNQRPYIPGTDSSKPPSYSFPISNNEEIKKSLEAEKRKNDAYDFPGNLPNLVKPASRSSNKYASSSNVATPPPISKSILNKSHSSNDSLSSKPPLTNSSSSKEKENFFVELPLEMPAKAPRRPRAPKVASQTPASVKSDSSSAPPPIVKAPPTAKPNPYAPKQHQKNSPSLSFKSSDVAPPGTSNYEPKSGQAPPPQQFGQAPPPQQFGQAPPPQQFGQAPPPQQFGQAPPPQQFGQAPPPQQFGQAPPPQQFGQAPPPQQFGQAPPPQQIDSVSPITQTFPTISNQGAHVPPFSMVQHSQVPRKISNPPQINTNVGKQPNAGASSSPYVPNSGPYGPYGNKKSHSRASSLVGGKVGNPYAPVGQSTQMLSPVASAPLTVSPRITRGRGLSNAKGNIYSRDHVAKVQDPNALLERQFPIFNWNNSGKIVYLAPQQPSGSMYGGQLMTSIKVEPLFQTLKIGNSISSFPGPLNAKSKRKDVEKWLESNISEYSSDGSKMGDLVLLNQILLCLSQNSGDVSSKEFQTAVLPILNTNINYNEIMNTNVPITKNVPTAYKLDTHGLNMLLGLLQTGKVEEGLSLCMSKGDFTMALLIANSISPEKFQRVASEFARNNFPLQKTQSKVHHLMPIISKIFAGASSSAIADFNNIPLEGEWALQHWRDIIVSIASNRLSGPFLSEFSGFLASRGEFLAADVCNILSKDSKSPLIINGNILFSAMYTEVYDFISRSPDTMLPLQKLKRAQMLADFGYFLEAQKYCDVLAAELKPISNQGEMGSKIWKQFQQLVFRVQSSSGTDQGWFGNKISKVNLDKMWGHLDKFIGGEEQKENSGVFSKFSPSISRTTSHVDLSKPHDSTASIMGDSRPPNIRHQTAQSLMTSYDDSPRNMYGRSNYSSSSLSFKAPSNYAKNGGDHLLEQLNAASNAPGYSSSKPPAFNSQGSQYYPSSGNVGSMGSRTQSFNPSPPQNYTNVANPQMSNARSNKPQHEVNHYKPVSDMKSSINNSPRSVYSQLSTGPVSSNIVEKTEELGVNNSFPRHDMNRYSSKPNILNDISTNEHSSNQKRTSISGSVNSVDNFGNPDLLREINHSPSIQSDISLDMPPKSFGELMDSPSRKQERREKSLNEHFILNSEMPLHGIEEVSEPKLSDSPSVAEKQESEQPGIKPETVSKSTPIESSSPKLTESSAAPPPPPPPVSSRVKPKTNPYAPGVGGSSLSSKRIPRKSKYGPPPGTNSSFISPKAAENQNMFGNTSLVDDSKKSIDDKKDTGKHPEKVAVSAEQGSISLPENSQFMNAPPNSKPLSNEFNNKNIDDSFTSDDSKSTSLLKPPEIPKLNRENVSKIPGYNTFDEFSVPGSPDITTRANSIVGGHHGTVGGHFFSSRLSQSQQSALYQQYEVEDDTVLDYVPIVEEDEEDEELISKQEEKRKEKEKQEKEKEEQMRKEKQLKESSEKARSKPSDGKGWFGIFKGGKDDGKPKPIKAKMGEKNAFYYDEKLKKWINKNIPLEEQIKETGPPPPPKTKMAPAANSSIDNSSQRMMPTKTDGASAPPVSMPNQMNKPAAEGPRPVANTNNGPSLVNASLDDLLSLGSNVSAAPRKGKRGPKRGYVNVLQQ